MPGTHMSYLHDWTKCGSTKASPIYAVKSATTSTEFVRFVPIDADDQYHRISIVDIICSCIHIIHAIMPIEAYFLPNSQCACCTFTRAESMSECRANEVRADACGAG